MAIQLLNFLLVLISLAHTAQCISDSSFAPESEMNYRYVTPRRSLPCSGNEPCHTLEEYASNPTYFDSNTVFYFYLGSHQLNTNLELYNIHNLHFQAMTDGIVSVTISFDELVGITWINCACSNVFLSSINFMWLKILYTFLYLRTVIPSIYQTLLSQAT